MGFKQGYSCAECCKKKWGSYRPRQPPLYIRDDGKFVFSGYVMCRGCGKPSKAIKIYC